jgi:hypothetical protein
LAAASAETRTSLERQRGSYVRSLAPASALQHVPTRELSEMKHRGNIYRDQLIPISLRILGRGRAVNRARVVHRNVYRSEFVDRLADQRLAAVRVGEVSCQVKQLPPAGRRPAARRLPVLPLTASVLLLILSCLDRIRVAHYHAEPAILDFPMSSHGPKRRKSGLGTQTFLERHRPSPAKIRRFP